MNTITFVLIIICIAISISALALTLYYIRDDHGRAEEPQRHAPVRDGSVSAGETELLRMEVTVRSDVLVNLGRENVARIMQGYADRLKEELERLNSNV